MRQIILKSCSFVFISLFVITSFAAAKDSVTVKNPVSVLTNSIVKLQKDVLAKHASLAGSPKKLYQIVKANIMSDIAINQMSGLTLGPKWRVATKSQRKEFVAEFSQMLTRTYANAILKVTKYDIKIYPLRTDAWKHENQITVRGRVIPKDGGSSSIITYYLERVGNTWKIYDFAVEGVSFMKNFQSQFESFPNIQAIIKKIKQVNAANR